MPIDSKLFDSDEDDGSSSGEEKNNAPNATKMNEGKSPDGEEDDDFPLKKPLQGGWSQVQPNKEESKNKEANEKNHSKGSESKRDNGPKKSAPREEKKKRRRRSRQKQEKADKHFAADGSDDDAMPHIPTLEEELDEDEEDNLPTVADAPKMLSLRIRSLAELDEDIKYTLPTASEGGVDLSALTKMLAPQSSLNEEDVEWDFKSLLQEVAHEINLDLEALRESSKVDEDDVVEPNTHFEAFAK